jgi:hypothetical protein
VLNPMQFGQPSPIVNVSEEQVCAAQRASIFVPFH